jgi:cytochrome c biogenesis protein CcmG/thiol:disulfide interchange protein DsbE
MSAAGTTARSSGRMAGRLQTVAIIVITAVVLGVLIYAASGQGPSSDGVTEINLGSGAAATSPVVGGLPPAFTGLTYDGKTVSLADYAGKPVWLTFGASWCPDCRTESADVEAVYKANKDKGLNVLGVFIQEPSADVSGYAQRAGLTFPIAVDERAVIADAYRTMGIPTHFFIGADGKIREVRIGALSRDEMDRAVAAILN